LLAGTGGQVGDDPFKGMQATPFATITVDNVPQRYAQGLCQGIQGFGSMFASAGSHILDGTTGTFVSLNK
jgi:hypothetical protein